VQLIGNPSSSNLTRNYQVPEESNNIFFTLFVKAVKNYSKFLSTLSSTLQFIDILPANIYALPGNRSG